MSEIITINLDPINDGIACSVQSMESTAGRFVVLGTDYNHRIISEKEFYGYINELGNAGEQKIYKDYLVIFDRRKVIKVSGECYFIGSFMIVEPSMDGYIFAYLAEEDIERIKEEMSGYFTELIIDGIHVDALQVG